MCRTLGSARHGEGSAHVVGEAASAGFGPLPRGSRLTAASPAAFSALNTGGGGGIDAAGGFGAESAGGPAAFGGGGGGGIELGFVSPSPTGFAGEAGGAARVLAASGGRSPRRTLTSVSISSPRSSPYFSKNSLRDMLRICSRRGGVGEGCCESQRATGGPTSVSDGGIVTFGGICRRGVRSFGAHLLGNLDDLLLELLADHHREVLGVLHHLPASLVHCRARRGYGGVGGIFRQ